MRDALFARTFGRGGLFHRVFGPRATTARFDRAPAPVGVVSVFNGGRHTRGRGMEVQRHVDGSGRVVIFRVDGFTPYKIRLSEPLRLWLIDALVRLGPVD